MSDIHESVLFQGLARPPMLFGVTLSFLMSNGMFNLVWFIVSGSFWSIGSAAIVHVLGKMACKVEPNIFNILAGYVSHFGKKVKLKGFAGNVYEPY